MDKRVTTYTKVRYEWKLFLLLVLVALALAMVSAGLWVGRVRAHQHSTNDDHLIGSGAWGDIELLSVERVTDPTNPDLVADVTVNPAGTYAFLANWGEPDCAGPEVGGQTSPDAGAWVIDITDLSDPKTVGFIPSHQDTRPGEGMQVIELTTNFFQGDMLVMNNEQCGKNGKGGVSLWDVTDPLKPFKLSEHFGDRGFADTHDIHSAYAWDAGENAYVVIVDNIEFPDVDIMDITNPRRPRLIAEYDLNAYNVSQPDLGLVESFIHDIVVKEIDGRFIMLVSYWDGGFVKLDVTDPANAVFLGDTEYSNPDPELLESAGISLTPEGNGHQAEFTIDNRFFIGTDEDFDPYRVDFQITTGPNMGSYPAGHFGWTVPLDTNFPSGLNGQTIWGGSGCVEDTNGNGVSDRSDVPLASSFEVEPGEVKVLVLTRGTCFFSVKVESAQLAGYDAVIIGNSHAGSAGGTLPDLYLCGSQGHAFTVTASALCIGHRAMHLLFADTPEYSGADGADLPPIGTLGEKIHASPIFDGWGYVHLFGNTPGVDEFMELDTYAIPEAHDPDFASGFGALSVHEVATDPQDPIHAYLSYYSGGIRSIEIQCVDPSNTSTCELVETGGYLDPHGNEFWGVEAFVRDGQTIILGSDMDSGLWIFQRSSP